jgi:cytochrome P450
MAGNTSSEAPASAPAFTEDLHDPAVWHDPFPLYRRFREAGPVVWLERHQMYAIVRYAELAEALMNWRVFSSGAGVAMNELACTLTTTLHLDPPEHDQIRKVVGRPVLPKAVEKLEPELRALAEQVVSQLLLRDRFDGVTEFAQKLPLGIVSEQVGLPEEGREQMLEWGAAGFDALGMIDEDRTQSALARVASAGEYMQGAVGRLKPGSWSDLLMQAGARGEIPPEHCAAYIQDYVYPSLDTTIHATSAGLKLFAEHPDQWELLRRDRSLLPGAVSEIVRLSTPIQWFTRQVAEDCVLGGTSLPKGGRVVMLYGCANRDERKFPDPDRFDITRKASEQLGFGRGKHSCMGMPLARLEMQVLFDVLAEKVTRIEVGDEKPVMNNVLRGLERLEVSFS